MSGSDFAGDLIGIVDRQGRRRSSIFGHGGFWNILKTFLNTELIGVEVKRKEMIQRLGVPTHKYNTFDTYLNYLHKAGYLYKPQRGWYGLAITIPLTLSVDDCRSEAYGLIDDDGIRRVVLPADRTLVIQREKEFFDKEEFEV